MSFQRSLVLVSLLVSSVTSMYTPHAHRDVFNHRSLFQKRHAIKVSRDVQYANAIAAQALNAKFADLTNDSKCNDGDVACLGVDFAECWQGKYVRTSCGSLLQCFALPSVNEAGTTVTCDTKDDALARFAAAGSSGGLTGSGSTGSSGSESSDTSSSSAAETTTTTQATTTQATTTRATTTQATTTQASTTAVTTTHAAAQVGGHLGGANSVTTTQQQTTTEVTTSTHTTTSQHTSSLVHTSSSAQSTQPVSGIAEIEAILSATVANPNVGQGTWYDTGLTACGVTNNNDQNIVAVSEDLFDNYPGATANPNLNPVCGKQIQITYQGQTQTATITDRCTGCKPKDIDMTPSLFQKINPVGGLGTGRLDGVSWTWL